MRTIIDGTHAVATQELLYAMILEYSKKSVEAEDVDNVYADFRLDLLLALFRLETGLKVNGNKEKFGAFVIAMEAWIEAEIENAECQGHESLDGAHMGETVYCDGTCR